MSAERATSPSEVAFMLGQIQSGLAVVQQTLSEDRMSAAQYRTEIRKELKDHTERMQHIEDKVNGAGRDISEMKPKVSSLDERAMMSKGAAQLAVVLGKAAHVISAAIGGVVVLAVERWLK